MRLLNKAPRVLVVDDHPDIADALAAFLNCDGIETRTATGCGEALQCVRDWVPDVVVLDIMMPGRDGFETAKLIRQYLPTESLAILAYTSFDESYLSQNGRKLDDFDGYCRKGNAPSSVLGLIQQFWAH
ncbi:response regulator [Paraburkholderia sp.]|uniref:response regulator n=1 Tax=Paraburkholderia sp. TaxID=1926495 RepID=UPI002388D571|nr:response regulator [Paraburkholderia sp.]MDE1181627.1 response regulator [Paraburkholderia sp.]